MKSILKRIRLRQAVGVYVAEGDIAVSHVLNTAGGPEELASLCQPVNSDELSPAVERLAGPFIGKKQARLISLGLPCNRVFHATRPCTGTARVSADDLLHKLLQSSTISADELVGELALTKPGKRLLASVAACRRKYLNSLVAAIQPLGARLARAEPVPYALLRAALARHRTPRRVRVALRFFLGPNDAIAMVSAGASPLCWRVFRLTPGNETFAVRSAARAIQLLIKTCGLDRTPDAVFVHGRPDLHEALRPFAAEFGPDPTWLEGPAYDAASIAFGVALGSFEPTEGAVDLARTVRPLPTLRELFPWGDVALQFSLWLCVGLLLHIRAGSLEDGLRLVNATNARMPWLKTVTDHKLSQEKTDLQARVQQLERFLKDRVVWARHLRDFPHRLPESVRLTSLAGQSELQVSDKKASAGKKEKKLVFNGTVPLPRDGAPPPEINEFLASIRESPVLKQDFSNVTLDKQKSGTESTRSAVPGEKAERRPQLSFSLICTTTQPGKKPVD